ncbi:MAG: transposase [Jatrophihabitans sp.]
MGTAPATEIDAYLLLERLRWKDGLVGCPHCGVDGRSYMLRPADGRSRPTRVGSRSVRRVWKCGKCRRQFSVLTGTVLAGTRISLRSWVGVVGDLVLGRSASPAELAQRHGISAEAARHIVRRLRAAASGCDDERRGRSGLRFAVVTGSEPAAGETDSRVEKALVRLLELDVDEARRIRESTPSRVRPRPQSGPTADYA